MMCLPGRMVIQSLIVHNSPWLAILFRLDDHSAAPFGWCVHWYLLNNAQPYIHVKPTLDCLLPMERNLSCLMDGYRLSMRVNMKVERGGTSHEWEWLPLAGVEC